MNRKAVLLIVIIVSVAILMPGCSCSKQETAPDSSPTVDSSATTAPKPEDMAAEDIPLESISYAHMSFMVPSGYGYGSITDTSDGVYISYYDGAVKVFISSLINAGYGDDKQALEGFASSIAENSKVEGIGGADIGAGHISWGTVSLSDGRLLCVGILSKDAPVYGIALETSEGGYNQATAAKVFGDMISSIRWTD